MMLKGEEMMLKGEEMVLERGEWMMLGGVKGWCKRGMRVWCHLSLLPCVALVETAGTMFLAFPRIHPLHDLQSSPPTCYPILPRDFAMNLKTWLNVEKSMQHLLEYRY